MDQDLPVRQRLRPARHGRLHELHVRPHRRRQRRGQLLRSDWTRFAASGRRRRASPSSSSRAKDRSTTARASTRRTSDQPATGPVIQGCSNPPTATCLPANTPFVINNPELGSVPGSPWSPTPDARSRSGSSTRRSRSAPPSSWTTGSIVRIHSSVTTVVHRRHPVDRPPRHADHTLRRRRGASVLRSHAVRARRSRRRSQQRRAASSAPRPDRRRERESSRRPIECINGVLQYQFWNNSDGNGTVGDAGDALLRDWTDNSTFIDAPITTTQYGVKVRCSTDLSCDTATNSAIHPGQRHLPDLDGRSRNAEVSKPGAGAPGGRAREQRDNQLGWRADRSARPRRSHLSPRHGRRSRTSTRVAALANNAVPVLRRRQRDPRIRRVVLHHQDARVLQRGALGNVRREPARRALPERAATAIPTSRAIRRAARKSPASPLFPWGAMLKRLLKIALAIVAVLVVSFAGAVIYIVLARTSALSGQERPD